ncbi:MAG: MBL fold metallo-hydrolase, partial [Dehalococcoidia bacterium]
MEEIVPGLFRLDIPITEGGPGWTTPYVFRGREGITLFDAGYGTRAAAAALTEQLAEIGHTPAEVRRLVVSHAHPDHLGMTRWLKHQSPECELVMIGRERMRYGLGRTRAEAEAEQNAWALKHGLDMKDHDLEDDGPQRWVREERDLDREMRAAREEEHADEG